jgi:hypothetical protein
MKKCPVLFREMTGVPVHVTGSENNNYGSKKGGFY